MLAAAAWAVCRYWDYLVVAWGWIVAAGAGMVVAVTMAACLMISWLAFGELFCHRDVDDWPDVLMGGCTVLSLIGGEALGVWRYLTTPDHFFTIFLGDVAKWSAIAGIVPVVLAGLFGKRKPAARFEDGPESAAETTRSPKKTPRKNRKYYLTPDGRMTQERPPHAMADVVVDLDVKPTR